MKKKEYLIDTDILTDHLFTDDETSLLEKLMISGLCFTSAINASELYFDSEHENFKLQIDKMLRALKVLGIHSRYSLDVFSFNKSTENFRDALFSVVAKKNNLIICTTNKERYSKTGIEVLDPNEI
jgi:predicted nucleic acid-binding protein